MHDLHILPQHLHLHPQSLAERSIVPFCPRVRLKSRNRPVSHDGADIDDQAWSSELREKLASEDGSKCRIR